MRSRSKVSARLAEIAQRRVALADELVRLETETAELADIEATCRRGDEHAMRQTARVMRRIGHVAARAQRAVAQARLLDLAQHANGEDREALRIAADVLRVLDEMAR